MSHPIQGWLVNAFGHSKGYRNGNQKTRLDTPTGPIEYDRPKITHAPDFESKYHQAHVRRPEEFEKVITDMVINGVSTRKVKDSLKSVTGKEVALSRSTVSRVTKRLRAEFRDWQRKDLSKLKVMYLF